ncbi:MAG: type IV secretion system protein [Rhodospirillales bacterium]|nr:type IV secretion system protein [Rhodospirillales bacterium]
MQVDLTQAQRIHSNDPGAIKAMLDSLTGDLLADIAGPLLTAGENIWEGLAAVVIVWTGVRIALSGGGFSGWDLARLVTALMVPRTILFYYGTPMPIGGQTLPEAIVGMGSWVADMVTRDSYSATWRWIVDFCMRALTEAWSAGSDWGVFWILGIGDMAGNLIAGAVLAALAVFMAIVSLLLVVIGYAQVIWAQFAIAIAVALGPIFVPFLLFEPLAFLFWGWLRTLLTYSLYSAVAACVVRVFLGAVRAASDGIWNSLTPDLEALGAALMWIVSYLVLALAGILAAFKIPELASGFVSGSVSGGGMLGALAATATAGKAAVMVKGAAALRK